MQRRFFCTLVKGWIRRQLIQQYTNQATISAKQAHEPQFIAANSICPGICTSRNITTLPRLSIGNLFSSRK